MGFVKFIFYQDDLPDEVHRNHFITFVFYGILFCPWYFEEH
jgi:hypothetical protein